MAAGDFSNSDGPSWHSGRQVPRGRGSPHPAGFKVVGLFAGIGGIECGLQHAGHGAELLCEADAGARTVLAAQFAGIPIEPNVCKLLAIPKVELVAAGFPCQDLSQAGRTAGIMGRNSALITEVFRLLRPPATRPDWVLLENVPFMLQLDRGKAMRYVIAELEGLGYQWAYRIVDTRAFGLPQRRQRVLILASRSGDPRDVLLSDDANNPPAYGTKDVACGFYWTEGNRGLGWAEDAVPTLKGGSTLGIPAPPAIWLPSVGSIVQPDIEDAERLQGFPSGWTLPAVTEGAARSGYRWKLVGNAVSVPVSRWVGEQLRAPRRYDDRDDDAVELGNPWPRAGWGRTGQVFRSRASQWPVKLTYQHLGEFLRFPTIPLSERATAGFLRRLTASTLRTRAGFLEDVAGHLKRMRESAA
jgi:DNA (cytosine-5)-methyltransferase 1